MATDITNCDVAIIGAGPTGLMAAQQLAHKGYKALIFERMPTPARKFLMAGKSGLNLTHSENLDAFTNRYGETAKHLSGAIKGFSNTAVRQWAHDLGVETFVGSSGRVFPKAFKASPLLRAWLKRLDDMGVELLTRSTWQGWSDDGSHLVFAGPDGVFRVKARAAILAMGGTSWPKLGSVGEWQRPLAAKGVSLEPFRAINCGFNVAWSEHFRTRFAGQPIKNCIISEGPTTKYQSAKGDVMVTQNGVEGGPVYKISAALTATLSRRGKAMIVLDLAPDHSVSHLTARLSELQGKRSLTDHIRRKTGLKGVQLGLLREFTQGGELSYPAKIAARIKAIPIPIASARPIEEAISVAGGIPFSEMDDNLMLTALPGTFCAGEMVAWDAPTGGYLLTACMAQGRQAASGAAAWLDKTCSPAN